MREGLPTYSTNLTSIPGPLERITPAFRLFRPLLDPLLAKKDKHVELKSITQEAATGNRKSMITGVGIATDTEFQGRNIAKRLMEYMMAHAKGQGYEKIYIHGPDVRATDFYEKIGFRKKNTLGGDYLGDMELRIPQDVTKKIKLRSSPKPYESRGIL